MDAIVRLHKAGYVIYLKDDGVILPGPKWSVYTKQQHKMLQEIIKQRGLPQLPFGPTD